MRKGQPERMSEVQKITIAVLQKETRKPLDINKYGETRKLKFMDYYSLKTDIRNNYQKRLDNVSFSNSVRNLQKKGYVELSFVDNKQKTAYRVQKCDRTPLEDSYGDYFCEDCPMKKKDYRGLQYALRVEEEGRCYFRVIVSDCRWDVRKHHISNIWLTDKGWNYKVEMNVKEDTIILKLISQINNKK